MFLKFGLAVAAALSLLILPAEPARADAKDALLGAVVGGIIGAGVERQRSRQTTVRRTTRTRASTRTRSTRRAAPVCGQTCQYHKEEQLALNHFGYNAGPVDGKPGRRTRAAITAFEAEMGLIPDGRLDPSERAFLVSSYGRATASQFGNHYQAFQQGGPRALLRGFNQDRLAAFQGGGAQPQLQPSIPVQQQPVAPAPNAGTVMASTPQQPSAAAPSAPAALAPLAPLTFATVSKSMDLHCAETQRTTIGNGGYVEVATAANATQALNEQFCLAREFTTGKGQQMTSAVQGMTATDLENYCGQIRDAIAGARGGLGSQPMDGVVEQVRQVAANSNMQPQQMVQAGEICVGIGYAKDDAEVALSGALFAVAGGQGSYGEIVGHHLREGFGTPANADKAREWLIGTIDKTDAGAPAAILPDRTVERNSVIRAAFGISSASATGGAIGNAGSGTLPTLILQPAGN